MSNRYGAVALRTGRALDAETLVREVGGAGPGAELVPSDVRPFSRKGHEGTISVISLANGWQVIWGGSVLAWGWDDPGALEKALERASAGGEAVYWWVEGVTCASGFTVYQDGRRVRNRVQAEDEVVEDDGDPLPGEPDEDRDEWTVVEMIVAPREEITGAPYVTFQVR